MTTINWIKCSDRMPSDDKEIIVKSWTGNLFRVTRYALQYGVSAYGAENYEWIPYDEQTWKMLNVPKGIAWPNKLEES